jgi:hypothetical protein
MLVVLALLAVSTLGAPPSGSDVAGRACWYAARVTGGSGADVRCVERVERVTNGRLW